FLEAAGTNRLEIKHTGGGDVSIINPSAADLSLGTNNATTLFLENGGNVGIGTIAPIGKLTVYGSARDNLILHTSDDTQPHGLAFVKSDGQNYNWNIYSTAGADTTDLRIAGGLETGITFLNDIVTIKGSDGYIGIGFGNTNPTYQLDVNGNSHILGNLYVEGGNVGIGTTGPRGILDVSDGTDNTAGGLIDTAVFTGVNRAITDHRATAQVQSNTTFGADVGATFGFSARTTTGSTTADMMAVIKGAKESAVSANKDGYLAFGTRESTGGITEAMRIDSDNNVIIGAGSVQGTTEKLNIFSSAVSAGPNLKITSGMDTGADYMSGLLFGVNDASDTTIGTIQAKEHTANLYGLEFRYYGAAGLATGITLLGDGNVGIGTISPQTKLHVWGGGVDIRDANLNFSGSTGRNITNVNKLTVTTIDPVYEIDGQKYATYGHSTVGLKEEVVGKVGLEQLIPDLYAYVIDFDSAETGSDLWLFREVTAFGNAWEGLIVMLTPEGKAEVWYELMPDENSVLIFGNTSVTVSYRLIAPRHDWPDIDTNRITDPDITGTKIR
ncbi:hypothetical protein MYX06_03490, partial [Patescibacteria group bacterium AH-259-L05]|nr:hypothetical protein [Patescibacteria group bacterium AH-259-L05]